MYDNHLSGTIPTELSALGNNLSFYDNDLIGTMPSGLCSPKRSVLKADCAGMSNEIECAVGTCCSWCCSTCIKNPTSSPTYQPSYKFFPSSSPTAWKVPVTETPTASLTFYFSSSPSTASPTTFLQTQSPFLLVSSGPSYVELLVPSQRGTSSPSGIPLELNLHSSFPSLASSNHNDETSKPSLVPSNQNDETSKPSLAPSNQNDETSKPSQAPSNRMSFAPSTQADQNVETSKPSLALFDKNNETSKPSIRSSSVTTILGPSDSSISDSLSFTTLSIAFKGVACFDISVDTAPASLLEDVIELFLTEYLTEITDAVVQILSLECKSESRRSQYTNNRAMTDVSEVIATFGVNANVPKTIDLKEACDNAISKNSQDLVSMIKSSSSNSANNSEVFGNIESLSSYSTFQSLIESPSMFPWRKVSAEPSSEESISEETILAALGGAAAAASAAAASSSGAASSSAAASPSNESSATSSVAAGASTSVNATPSTDSNEATQNEKAFTEKSDENSNSVTNESDEMTNKENLEQPAADNRNAEESLDDYDSDSDGDRRMMKKGKTAMVNSGTERLFGALCIAEGALEDGWEVS